MVNQYRLSFVTPALARMENNWELLFEAERQMQHVLDNPGCHNAQRESRHTHPFPNMVPNTLPHPFSLPPREAIHTRAAPGWNSLTTTHPPPPAGQGIGLPMRLRRHAILPPTHRAYLLACLPACLMCRYPALLGIYPTGSSPPPSAREGRCKQANQRISETPDSLAPGPRTVKSRDPGPEPCVCVCVCPLFFYYSGPRQKKSKNTTLCRLRAQLFLRRQQGRLWG